MQTEVGAIGQHETASSCTRCGFTWILGRSSEWPLEWAAQKSAGVAIRGGI